MFAQYAAKVVQALDSVKENEGRGHRRTIRWYIHDADLNLGFAARHAEHGDLPELYRLQQLRNQTVARFDFFQRLLIWLYLW